MTTSTTDSWMAATRQRARMLQSQLSRMESAAREQQISESLRERMLQPYRRLLESVYLEDMPLAQLVDQADLVVHVKGQAADAPSPKLTLLTKIMGEFRDAVGELARVFTGADKFRLPNEFELRFAGLAHGSLFLGFQVQEAQDKPGSAELSRAASDAIDHMLTVAPAIVSEDPAPLRAMQDPAERDTIVGIVHRLSPSGKMGVRELNLYGRGRTKPAVLTVDTRRHARSILSKPLDVLPAAIVMVGTVREVDLDQQRFELRNVEGRPDVRCAIDLTVEEARLLINKRVRVVGRPEYGRGAKANQVRLLWVDEYELLD